MINEVDKRSPINFELLPYFSFVEKIDSYITPNFMALVLTILTKNNIKIQNIQCFKSISKLKKLQNVLLDQKLSYFNYQLSYAASKQNLTSFFLESQK